MLPSETPLIYFYVLLGGFMTVWTFRKITGTEKKISEFEYVGFSAFWGIFLIFIWGIMETVKPSTTDLFTDPFAAGFIMSLLGMLCSFIVGQAFMLFLKDRNSLIKKWIKNIFKKGR